MGEPGVNGSSPRSYGPPVLRVDKGNDYTIEFSIPTPGGVAAAVLPIAEVRRLARLISRLADEQAAQMDDDLSKMAGGG